MIAGFLLSSLFFMFSLKKKKTKLASVSSLLFLSFLFSLPFSLEFPKIRAKNPKKKHRGEYLSAVVGSFYPTREEREEEREDSLG